VFFQLEVQGQKYDSDKIRSDDDQMIDDRLIDLIDNDDNDHSETTNLKGSFTNP
jgi:hypothetical protein